MFAAEGEENTSMKSSCGLLSFSSFIPFPLVGEGIQVEGEEEEEEEGLFGLLGSFPFDGFGLDFHPPSVRAGEETEE